MRPLVILSLSLFSALSLVSGLPSGRSIDERGWEFEDIPCESLKIRKEWRSLTLEEKRSYIDAVKCLKSTPPKPNLFDGVRSLFDQFQAEHISLMLRVHWSGSFIPFHRYYVSQYEKSLEDCGYSGGHPYWSWSMDVEAGSLEQNEMFSDETGFGGNGVYVAPEDRIIEPFPPFSSPLLPPSNTTITLPTGSGGGCVPGGPFSESQGWMVNVGLSDITYFNPHCLVRDFSYDSVSQGSEAAVEEVLAQPDFGAMTRKAEAMLDGNPAIHNSGHGGIGGEMLNVFSSPGDPLFFLHHANLDRVWWMWQQQDLSTRLRAVGSNLVTLDFSNSVAQNVTLMTQVNIGSLAPAITLLELQNTEANGLCYRYADPPSSI